MKMGIKHEKTLHLNFEHERSIYFETKYVKLKTKAYNDQNPSSLLIITPLILTIFETKHPNRDRLITKIYSVSLISSYFRNGAH